jgi:putative transcriptional regulator
MSKLTKKESKSYKSAALAVAHEAAEALFKVGAIDQITMKEFDSSCLQKIKEMSPEHIKDIRTSQSVSQNVFANYLNISAGLLSEWERGVRKPSGAALKLLSVVENKGLSVLL